MQKAAHGVLEGEAIKDAAEAGGDIQVGRASWARFRSGDSPQARREATVYATAKPYMDLKEPNPECPHPVVILEHYGSTALHAPMPPEHLACSFKPGTVDVQAQYTYRMNGHVDEYGDYESDDTDPITYEW